MGVSWCMITTGADCDFNQSESSLGRSSFSWRESMTEQMSTAQWSTDGQRWEGKRTVYGGIINWWNQLNIVGEKHNLHSENDNKKSLTVKRETSCTREEMLLPKSLHRGWVTCIFMDSTVIPLSDRTSTTDCILGPRVSPSKAVERTTDLMLAGSPGK